MAVDMTAHDRNRLKPLSWLGGVERECALGYEAVGLRLASFWGLI